MRCGCRRDRRRGGEVLQHDPALVAGELVADAFLGLAVADVTVSNTDNDTAGITVTPTSGLTTTEAGGQATFDVVLDTQPTANVTINIATGDATEYAWDLGDGASASGAVVSHVYASGRYTAINTVTDWVKVPARTLTLGNNDALIAERAHCEIYELDEVSNQLRH